MTDRPTPPLSGTRAPDISLPRTSYEAVWLPGLHGEPFVLVFYPGDWEPVSREHRELYQHHLLELQPSDAALTEISVDSSWSREAFGRPAGLTFPLPSAHPAEGAVCRVCGACSGRAAVGDAEGVVFWYRSYPKNLNPGVDRMSTTLETMATK